MVMWPWLLPMPRPAWRIVAIALCLGGGSFSLIFVGLQTVSPFEAAILLQLVVPFTMMLSVLVLGERIYSRRGLDIALTSRSEERRVGNECARTGSARRRHDK